MRTACGGKKPGLVLQQAWEPELDIDGYIGAVIALIDRFAGPPGFAKSAVSLCGHRRPQIHRAEANQGRTAASCAARTDRAVTRDGPYQVRLRPSTRATRWAGNASGPSSGLNG
jgi:hypothetical protein